jgi:hypothetical protein
MGEVQKQPFQLPFSACVKFGFQGSRVSSDTGLILLQILTVRPLTHGSSRRAEERRG